MKKEMLCQGMSDRLGIIFIDCWQTIQDHSQWQNLPDKFDFYQNMVDCLQHYQADNMVFHTGTFGSHKLATKLEPWHTQGNSVNIMNLEAWVCHYQNRQLYNWLVVGAHWQRCTHEKTLGFYNLLDMKKLDSKLRIFSHMDCTAKFLNDDIDRPELTICNAADYQQDSLIWRVEGRVAELHGPL